MTRLVPSHRERCSPARRVALLEAAQRHAHLDEADARHAQRRAVSFIEGSDRFRTAVRDGERTGGGSEEEKKTFRDFAFDPEGLKDAVAWLNEIFEEKFAG